MGSSVTTLVALTLVVVGSSLELTAQSCSRPSWVTVSNWNVMSAAQQASACEMARATSSPSLPESHAAPGTTTCSRPLRNDF